MIDPFTADERARILKRYHKALAKYERAMDDADYDAADNHFRTARRAENAYFERIHYVVICPCPFDGRKLIRSFDPYGTDGLYWQPGHAASEPPTCAHFCGTGFSIPPDGGDGAAQQLPQAAATGRPYVIPRLLEHDGVIATISQLSLDTGDAIAITYFANPRPPPEHLFGASNQHLFNYTTQMGISGWRPADRDIDTDLSDWQTAGKIRWCAPGSDNTFLSRDPVDACPYVRESGHD